jgi:two-component system cell cycle sensor histidine kinase/response regulator CckA
MTNLSAYDKEAIRAYWTFYEPHRESIVLELRNAAATRPEWLPIFEEMMFGPYSVKEQETRGIERGAIFDGRWDPYLSALRRQGARYAHAGIRYSAWIDMIRTFRDAVRAKLTVWLQQDVEKLAGASVMSHGMNRLHDIQIENIGEAYVAAKEQAAAGSEERYRAMFEHSPQPMWMFDRDTLRFVSVNDAAVEAYGYSRDEFTGMTLADIRPAEDVAAMRVDVAIAIGAVARKTWRHIKKDGSLISVEITGNDFVVDGRNVRLALITDVTARERAQLALHKTQEQLRHAQKMDAIGQLAGGVAHDFNNVLTVISTCSELLEETLEVGDARREDASEIRRAAERATVITRQLLTLSRHSIVAPRSLKLNEVIENFAPMLRRFVGQRVKLVTQITDVPTVLADQGQLEQVLMNLAVNARDAMPSGGRLTIETNVQEIDDDAAAKRQIRPGTYVVVSLTDTGVGMSFETQQRMFDPFFTTKEVGKGTGLGLAIVHGIVSQAGGEISAYSELGRGTTLRIHLPVTAETILAKPATPTVSPRTLPAMTVLVVDDQREVRAVAGRVLQEAGCKILESSTADEARRICVSHDGAIDVVVLDMVLADARGDLLAHQLRALRPALKVVMMSGYPAGALSAGGGTPPDLLAKPFTPSELRAAVARAAGLAADRETRTGTAPPAAHSRVLVADDDDDLRRVIARALRRAELEVVEVDTGSKAIAEVKKRPFDVILSDVHMPDGGGLDLMRAVRRVDLDVPVLLMSGAPDVQSAAAAVEYGAFRYLTKPLDIDALGKLVQHASRAHALARLRREASSINGTNTGAADRVGLEVRFDQAVDRLWLAFQPIVNATSGALFGVEALMRSDEQTMPGPQAVLEAATQLARLPQVGRRVRMLAATALAPHADDLALFVNLHPDDLADVELIADTAPLSLIASRVILEITERASLEITPQLTSRLARLRALGFRIAVDDIGAGYSGLTSFTELTPEIVKIDMSLVRNVHLSAVKQRTISALCNLCHEVGCTVVGEGVETLEERDCLITLGCDLLQGYLLGRPVRELPALQ